MDDDAFLMACEMGLVEWVTLKDKEGGLSVGTEEQYLRLWREYKVRSVAGRVVTFEAWTNWWDEHDKKAARQT